MTDAEQAAFPAGWEAFTDPGFIFIGSGSLFLMPMPALIFIAFAIAIAVLVRGTALGLLVETVGINRRAATLSGVGTPLLSYAISDEESTVLPSGASIL